MLHTLIHNSVGALISNILKHNQFLPPEEDLESDDIAADISVVRPSSAIAVCIIIISLLFLYEWSYDM